MAGSWGVGGRPGDEKIKETGNFGIRESWTSGWLMPSKFVGSIALDSLRGTGGGGTGEGGGADVRLLNPSDSEVTSPGS